jgi:hypothetical protein
MELLKRRIHASDLGKALAVALFFLTWGYSLLLILSAGIQPSPHPDFHSSQKIAEAER